VDDYVYKRRYQMEIDEAKFYWLQVVDAVAHLHSRNVIHVDITLANILFHDDGRVQLADFGHAERLYDGCSVRDFSGIGTPYTAPEVMQLHR
jgi:serine/threonine protein kinase